MYSQHTLVIYQAFFPTAITHSEKNASHVASWRMVEEPKRKRMKFSEDERRELIKEYDGGKLPVVDEKLKKEITVSG